MKLQRRGCANTKEGAPTFQLICDIRQENHVITFQACKMFQGNPSNLWLSIGQAFWNVQVLEFAIAHYLVLLNITPGDEEEAHRQLTSSFQSTMGRLLKKLRDSVSIHPEMEGRLRHLTEERNWLAHRIYRLHHTDIHDAQKFSQLLRRIDSLGEESLNVAKEVSILCLKWCVANGINEQDIDAESRRLVAQWWGIDPVSENDR